ncbi:MAG: hypothetical protein FJ041_01975, partial [Candidatus Cloacimonetes bacterium]|nr:hypothetical protein [Candidatus Cloacimonadota bacterium]
MPFKSFKLYTVITIIAILSVIIAGCGKQGSRFANKAPNIEITSYEGYDPNKPYTDSTAITLFQQKIFWHASDPDGIVSGYAFRILDEAGNPISTAGNSFIDTMGEITPQAVKDKFGPKYGWVMHYQPGANQSIPLDDPSAKRTIWTTQKYALVNFLASTVTGLPDTTISSFEVICVDNRGTICENKAFRIFKSYSERPTCFISTTKGNPNGGEVGSGIKLSFTLDDKDPFIQPTPWYYKFKIEKVNKTTNVVDQNFYPDEWYETRNLPRLNEYLLTKYTTPRLASDYNASGTQTTYTRVIAKVIDLAGIESEPDTLTFAVKEGFHPKTVVYMQRTYALGLNHFTEFADESTPEVYPSTSIGTQPIYATPYFKNVDSIYTVINSTNLKNWIRWGWHGEYARVTVSGSTTSYDYTEDNPYNKKVDVLLDENTDKNYYSEITYFDIRLDGEPYNYPPLAQSIVVDQGTGKRWLRVPINSSLGQTVVLTNLASNTPANPYHIFEVRAVDLQDEVDPTPAIFKFKVLDLIPKEQKSRILLLDNTKSSTTVPASVVKARYEELLSNFPGMVDYRKRPTQSKYDIPYEIALSDLQSYKFVIYYSDNFTQGADIAYDIRALNLYLKNGGNMMVCNNKIADKITQPSSTTSVQQMFPSTFFNRYFGITRSTASVSTPQTSAFFIKAKKAVDDFPDLSVAFDLNPTNPDPQPL